MPPFNRRRDDDSTNEDEILNGLLANLHQKSRKIDVDVVQRATDDDDEDDDESYYRASKEKRKKICCTLFRSSGYCGIGLLLCIILLLAWIQQQQQQQQQQGHQYQNIDNNNKSSSSLRSSSSSSAYSTVETKELLARLPSARIQITPFRPNDFCFLHISKCAGASWIELLRNLLPDFHPRHSHGEEYSLEYSQQTWPGSQMLLSLKSPRRHIWSLFTECKYDDWGRRQIHGTDFPNAGNGKHTDDEKPSEETDDDDFVHWMDHFFEGPQNHFAEPPPPPASNNSSSLLVPIKIESYRCYHPANYQARHLVSHMKVPHVTSQNDVDVVPPLSLVWEKYQQDISWTGITEFFHASKCLLYWRYLKGNNNNSTSAISEMQTYLNEHCKCVEDGPTHTEKIVTHHEEGHREQFYDMPSSTLERMDALTSVDRMLYQQALVDFIGNVIEMELDLEGDDDGDDTHVLCNHATEKYEAELEYLLVDTPTRNITELVHLMRTERKQKGKIGGEGGEEGQEAV